MGNTLLEINNLFIILEFNLSDLALPMKKKTVKKKRADKYESKLSILGSLDEVLKVAVSTKKEKKAKKK